MGSGARALSSAAASALRRKLFSEIPVFDEDDVPENKKEILR